MNKKRVTDPSFGSIRFIRLDQPSTVPHHRCAPSHVKPPSSGTRVIALPAGASIADNVVPVARSSL